jgi:hypothetical protein
VTFERPNVGRTAEKPVSSIKLVHRPDEIGLLLIYFSADQVRFRKVSLKLQGAAEVSLRLVLLSRAVEGGAGLLLRIPSCISTSVPAWNEFEVSMAVGRVNRKHHTV